MDIVVTEVERRERTSVIDVKVNARGSSVGASFFILCSLRQLAKLRGSRHIAKLDDQPKRGQMLVAFLRPGESPGQVAPDLQGVTPDAVLDLEQFAEICASMK
jgi:hypothetical protein